MCQWIKNMNKQTFRIHKKNGILISLATMIYGIKISVVKRSRKILKQSSNIFMIIKISADITKDF